MNYISEGAGGGTNDSAEVTMSSSSSDLIPHSSESLFTSSAVVFPAQHVSQQQIYQRVDSSTPQIKLKHSLHSAACWRIRNAAWHQFTLFSLSPCLTLFEMWTRHTLTSPRPLVHTVLISIKPSFTAGLLRRKHFIEEICVFYLYLYCF